MKLKGTISPLKMALWLCLAALLVFTLTFPEIMLQRKISFLVWDDYLIDYLSTFSLTGFFYQGGIQLWDFFGQLPHTFFMATHGMFRLPNILTAIVYVLLSPFADNSGQFFDRVFSIVYVGSYLCIRTIGIFLLLKRLTEDRWILMAGTVIFSVFFCPSTILLSTFYQHFFPLLMYFILSFFITWRLVYLGMAVLFMMISFSQGLVHSFCMYLGINLFVVACCLYSVFVHQDKLGRWREFFKKNARPLLTGSLWLLAASCIILGPYLYMILFCLKDVAFDVGHSRLTDMLNITQYFQGIPPLDQTLPADYFRRMLDFTNSPGRSFFLGYMMFFLSGVGLTLSRDRRKWIFFITIVLIWLINFPRNTFSIGVIGHLLNVLTNPFRAMVTSYQMATNAILWFLLMPLAVMGLGVLKEIGEGIVPKASHWRGFFIFIVVFVINGCSYQPGIVKIYVLMSMVISMTGLGLLIVAAKHRPMRLMATVLLAGLILTDMALSAWNMKQYIAANCALRPHLVESLPQQGSLGLDFRNPKIFPFVGQSDRYPDVGNPYLWTLADMSSTFNSDINRQNAFKPVSNHRPRHISFQGWTDDPLMGKYMAQNDHLFFFARYALQQGPGTFEKIVHRQLSGDVMMVDGQEPSLRADIPPQLAPSAAGADQWFAISRDIKDEDPGWVYEKGMAIWDFPVGGAIPDYFATNIFTHDHWVRFYIQSADQKYIELSPAQGQLLRSMTFDVQNIKEGKVFVALPADTPLAGLKGVLLLKSRDAAGITSVWLHHSDETGITFQAPAQGWLGIQFPYDPKWRIDVDGKQVHFYRVDKSFIGLPLGPGEHKILIRYWPGSWLRWGLPISAVLAFVLFIILILYALCEAPVYE